MNTKKETYLVFENIVTKSLAIICGFVGLLLFSIESLNDPVTIFGYKIAGVVFMILFYFLFTYQKKV